MTQPEPSDPAGFPGAKAEYSGRRLGRDVLIYGLGTVFSRIASFVMLPVYTRLLTASDYGLLQMLDMTLDVASILVSAGVTMGVMRFYFKAESERGRQEVLGSAFLLQVGLNLLGTGALMLSAGPVWRLGLRQTGSPVLVFIAAANFTLGALAAVPLLRMQMERRAILYSLTTLGKIVLQLSLNILFLIGFRWGVRGILLSNMITSVVIGGASTAWMMRTTRLAVSRAAIRDLRRFGVPYQIATAATFILTFGDRFFLQGFRGLAAVGVYGIAYQFGFLLDSLASSPFQRAWDPLRYKLAAEARAFRDAKYNQGLFYLSLVLVTTAVGMCLFVRPVLRVMADPEFWPAASIVPVVVAAYLVQSWSGVAGFGIGVSERTKYMTYAMWLSVIVVIAFYALLIPRFGAMGAAVATLLAFVVRFGLLYRFSQRLWPITYRWGPALRLAGIGTLVTVPAFAIDAGVVAEGLLGAALLAVYLGLVWSVVLKREDRQLVREAARSSPRTIIARLAGA